MGSDLRVNSTPGEGTEFMFSIAFQKSTQQQAGGNRFPGAAIEEPFNGFSNNKKVLLAEDNQVNQLITAKFSKSWGLETHIANYDMEALQMVQCEQYDLILMDLQMPEMDGFEASRQLRRMVESGAMDQSEIHGNIRQINQLGEQLIQELEAIM